MNLIFFLTCSTIVKYVIISSWRYVDLQLIISRVGICALIVFDHQYDLVWVKLRNNWLREATVTWGLKAPIIMPCAQQANDKFAKRASEAWYSSIVWSV